MDFIEEIKNKRRIIWGVSFPDKKRNKAIICKLSFTAVSLRVQAESIVVRCFNLFEY